MIDMSFFDPKQSDLFREIDEKHLPKPTGYKMLVLLPKLKETFGDSLIVRPDINAKEEQQASMLGMVVKQGPDCYADRDKFPTGPWCREGDLVVFSTYAGTRIKVNGVDFRLMSDDTIQAVIEDPTKFSRG